MEGKLNGFRHRILIAVVIALTGVGAGVITAPLLILFLHVPLDIAVSTALAYSAIVKLIVVPAQIVRRQVDYKVLGFMLIELAIGGVAGGIVGTYSEPKIPNGSLRLALSLWLTVIGFQFCYQAIAR